MPVINNADIAKYKKYKTVPVKGKDGVTRPITKCFYEKTCPQCGSEMALVKFVPGSIRAKALIRWKCPDKHCNYSEREQSYEEALMNDFHPTHHNEEE